MAWAPSTSSESGKETPSTPAAAPEAPPLPPRGHAPSRRRPASRRHRDVRSSGGLDRPGSGVLRESRRARAGEGGAGALPALAAAGPGR